MGNLNALHWIMSALPDGEEVPRRVEGSDDSYCVHGIPLEDACTDCAEEAEVEGEEAEKAG